MILFLTHKAQLFCFFSTERRVLKRKEEVDQEMALFKASSRDELQHNVLVKMKSVTGAEEDICISMLESNGYDLKTSIEAYFMQK